MFQQDIIQDANWYACQLTQCLWRGIDPRTPHHGELPAGEMQLADDRGQARIWFTCRLSGCNLAQLRLQGASFHRSELEGCSFADSDLTSAIFAEVQALRCDFERATLTRRRRRRPGSANAR